MQVDNLTVSVFENRAEMGRRAAYDTAGAIRETLNEKETVTMIFAAAPSQDEMLDALVLAPDIDWTRIHAFHMDEYVGLPGDAPQSFGCYLTERLFKRLCFASVNRINGAAKDPETECSRYASLLAEHPVDIVCLGIGENGHLAFNDPPVADFNDPMQVKVVTLDSVCRMQQVHDGCFESLKAVPREAITLTIPALLAAKALFCVVPGPTKADAVLQTLTGPIAESCPASVLRTHPGARLYLDTHSASRLQGPEVSRLP